MIRIAQHTPEGGLVDLRELLADVQSGCPVEQWRVHVQECLGQGAAEVERLTAEAPALLGTQHLESLYQGIYQTIDGEFVGLNGGQEVCRLVAVDSSYWEVSGPSEFEVAVQGKYTLYGNGGV